MKNNKGFTLVEVLAVVAILVAVIAIIAPKIFKSFQNSEDTIYTEQINSIIDISRLYMNRHTNLLPEEENYVITINELKEDGLIETNSNIINPKNRQPLTGCVVVSFENNKYKYEYVEGNVCNK